LAEVAFEEHMHDGFLGQSLHRIQSLNSTKKFFLLIMSFVLSLPCSRSQLKNFCLGILHVFHISKIDVGVNSSPFNKLYTLFVEKLLPHGKFHTSLPESVLIA
jgi:hypothetical protein